MPESIASDSSPNFDYYDDPLYLSTNDQTSATLSSSLFNGHDFLGWKREVLMALTAKNKDGFIDGSCSMPPSTDKRHKQWKRCDFMVMRWISNSIDKSLRDNFKYVVSSKNLWDDLLERFGVFNALEVYQITKDLVAVSQENISLVEYYSKMKNLWETLESLDPLPVCTCGKVNLCTCTLLKRIVERENNAKTIQFLMNLNSSYDGIRTQILSLEPLPSINKVLALLQKIERQKQITDTVFSLTESNAYASFRQSDQKMIGFQKTGEASTTVKHCDHCNKNGHTSATCFGLTKCPHCNKTGHNPANCFVIRGFPGDKNKGKDKAPTNYKSTVPARGVNSADLLPESPLEDSCLDTISHNDSNKINAVSSVLTSEVLDGLVTSVVDQALKQISDQQPALSSANFAGMISPYSHVFTVCKPYYTSTWLVDSGASDHMTYNIDLLSDVHVFAKPISVGLPDGSIKYVHKKGTVKLTHNIKLTNAFYLPDFRQNLLSISKLLDNNNLSVLFTSLGCVFQDLSNDKIVAKGKRIGDLYKFLTKPLSSSSTALVNKISSLVNKKFQLLNIPTTGQVSSLSAINRSVDLFHF
ncbi:uncharacterized protein LOC141632000 [Silene latifolia]|uniref:uncharacterized protein LOC141632000 n=1 Tax=Silene latifolia TaxID=37657 RepID=UPI003D773A39